MSNGCNVEDPPRYQVKVSGLNRNGTWKNNLPPIYHNTPHLMSSVHPRTKKHVGDRLAQAAWTGKAYGVRGGSKAFGTAFVGPVVSVHKDPSTACEYLQ